jgi:hypothetical protein
MVAVGVAGAGAEAGLMGAVAVAANPRMRRSRRP